jgi:hypothetical protein
MSKTVKPMTVDVLQQKLGQYDARAGVTVVCESDPPLMMEITGVQSRSEYSISHLFDEGVTPPRGKDQVIIRCRIATRRRSRR